MGFFSPAAWFTSGEDWDSVFPSLLVAGLSGACKCCWINSGWGSTWKLSWAHTPGQLKAVQHPCLHAASQSCYVDFLLPGKTFLLAIFLFISGSKFMKCLTTQGALQLHHLHCHSAGRSHLLQISLKGKTTSRKELEAELDEKCVIKKN